MPSQRVLDGANYVLLVASTLLIFGCASARQPSVLIAPYADRGNGPAAQSGSFPADHAAAVLGLPALKAIELPADTRELRISDWYSMILGTPVPVLRLIEQRGRAPRGEWLWVWSQLPDERRFKHRCVEGTRKTRQCAAVAAHSTVNWAAVAARFDSLGAWSLKGGCDRGPTDSGELLMQRLEGNSFDSYRCIAPHYQQPSPSVDRATAIYEYFHVLAKDVAPPRGA